MPGSGGVIAAFCGWVSIRRFLGVPCRKSSSLNSATTSRVNEEKQHAGYLLQGQNGTTDGAGPASVDNTLGRRVPVLCGSDLPMKPVITTFVALLSGAVLTLLALKGYDLPWTGFAQHVPANKDAVPAKTLWDWMDLLVVPVVLALGAFLLEGSRKKSERITESDRQKQQVLDGYLHYISELLLSGHLSNATTGAVARGLARTRTLAALRQLDGKRKAQILQFLYEARMIYSDPVINLNGADFRGALLDEATLSGAELRGVYFNAASIRNAVLVGSDLRGSDFTSVDFTSSNLSKARLAQAKLDHANIRAARVDDVDLSDVDLGKIKMTYQQRERFSHV